MTRRLLLAALVLALFPLSAFAQDPPVTSYEFRIYSSATATTPVTTNTYPATSATCGLTKPVNPGSAITSNPNIILFDDPAMPTRDCSISISTAPTTGPIATLPSGSYQGVLVAISSEGPSVESNRALFTRARVPAAVTGVRLIR